MDKILNNRFNISVAVWIIVGLCISLVLVQLSYHSFYQTTAFFDRYLLYNLVCFLFILMTAKSLENWIISPRESILQVATFASTAIVVCKYDFYFFEVIYVICLVLWVSFCINEIMGTFEPIDTINAKESENLDTTTTQISHRISFEPLLFFSIIASVFGVYSLSFSVLIGYKPNWIKEISFVFDVRLLLILLVLIIVIINSIINFIKSEKTKYLDKNSVFANPEKENGFDILYEIRSLFTSIFNRVRMTFVFIYKDFISSILYLNKNFFPLYKFLLCMVIIMFLYNSLFSIINSNLVKDLNILSHPSGWLSFLGFSFNFMAKLFLFVLSFTFYIFLLLHKISFKKEITKLVSFEKTANHTIDKNRFIQRISIMIVMILIIKLGISIVDAVEFEILRIDSPTIILILILTLSFINNLKKKSELLTNK